LYVELVAVSNRGLEEHSDGVWQGIYSHLNEQKLVLVYDATYRV
jgi:Zn/Cd-binding protein ZinT